MSAALSPQEALIYIMVTMSAVDREMTDNELLRIGHMVKSLPVFANYDVENLVRTAEECGKLLSESGGLDKILNEVIGMIPPQLHETAYALAVEVAAVDLTVKDEELRFLQLLRDHLQMDKLAGAAIERGAKARYRKI